MIGAVLRCVHRETAVEAAEAIKVRVEVEGV
jgi:hypothetical protein